MAGTLWALALRYLDARRRRPAPTAKDKPPLKRPTPLKRPNPQPHPAARSAESALGHRLAGEPELLERMVSVRPNSVAVMLTKDQPPQLKFPGELIRPSLVPALRPVRVVVVSTAETHLDVTVRNLVSLDGYPIERVKIRLAVQFSDNDRYATLVDLVPHHAADLDDYLLGLVQREVTNSLQQAVRNNRLADLNRPTLQRVLEDRWLPRGLAGGVLLRRSFTVLESVSATTTESDGSADDTEVLPQRTAAEPPSPFSRPRLTLAPPIAARPRLDLTMDARLHRVWRDYADEELLGIAGAKESDGATVVAVPTQQLGAYESSRLEEAFKKYYADARIRVVLAVADSYSELVRAWLGQVESPHARLISVQSTDNNATLRISVVPDRVGGYAAAREVSVGRHADRQALRALLPHERVEFVAAGIG